LTYVFRFRRFLLPLPPSPRCACPVPQPNPVLAVRIVPIPVDVQMISVAKLNIPLPSLSLRTAWTFPPTVTFDVNVFTFGVLYKGLIGSPVIRWNERENSTGRQMVLTQNLAFALFVVLNCLLGERSRSWVALNHRCLWLYDGRPVPGRINTHASSFAATVNDIFRNSFTRVP
jgi:hypothetical protein